MPLAGLHRSKPAVAPGSRRASLCVITKCPLECFSEAWRCSRSSLETVCCTGIGGCCEAVAESDAVADGHAVAGWQRRLCAGCNRDPAPAQKYGRRNRFFRAVSFGRRGFADSQLSRGYPATETTEARTHRTPACRSEKSKSVRHPERNGARESFLRRPVLQRQRIGAPGKFHGPPALGICFPGWDACQRSVSHRYSQEWQHRWCREC